jgi:predicted DNA binding protein
MGSRAIRRLLIHVDQEIDAEVASRANSLDLGFQFTAELDDGRRIEAVWERGSSFAFLVADADDDPAPSREDESQTFGWFRDSLLDLDADELLEIAASLRERDVEVSVADLAKAPRELDLTDRAAEAIRDAIARDLGRASS